MKRCRLRPRGRRGEVLASLDALLREVVLARDGRRCRRCGRGPRPGRAGGLQAAHIIPKGRCPALRYVLENVVCLCGYCHIVASDSWHKDPIKALIWAGKEIGQAQLERLVEMSRIRVRRPFDPITIGLYLQGELSRFSTQDKEVPSVGRRA